MIVGVVQATAIPMAWRMEQTSEPETGARHCAVYSLGHHVMAMLSKRGLFGRTAWTVTVGVDNEVGSLRYLRVNDRIFQTSKLAFRGDEADEIVEQLKRPGEFAFEWARAPDSAKQPGLFGIGDFAARAADCEAWIGGTSI
jgi:hypothetical protein